MSFFRFLALWLLSFAFVNVVAAQDAPTVTDKLDTLVQAFDTELRELRALVVESDKAEFLDRQALVFRQDDRSFQLLADADALALAVAGLPEDSERRRELSSHLVEELRDTSQAVFNRLDELDRHIAKNTQELSTLSGDARVSMQAYLQALESIRFKYYEALINHYGSRKILGLPFEVSQEKLTRVLRLHAEELSGQIEFASSARADIGSRLKADPENADLHAALTSLNNRRAESIEHLGLAVKLLDRLEVDTSGYRALLLQESEGVSVNMFQQGVVGQLVEEWLDRAETSLVDNTPDILLNLVIFFAVLFVFRWLSRITRRVVRASCDRSSLDLSVLLKDILVSASGGAVMILGILMALSQVGISLGPMLAGLGVAGFIVGFALQDTLANFAAGAMILIYRPYDVDDFVEVTGAAGLVKKMSLVSTTIVTFDNQTLVIPNSKIWGDVIKNVTAQKVRRVDLVFGIGYGDDIIKTEQVLTDILDAHEYVLKTPAPLIKVHELGDSSVNLAVRPWVKTEHYWDVYWDLTRAVKLRFDEEGITIPYPQRDVHLFKEAVT